MLQGERTREFTDDQTACIIDTCLQLLINRTGAGGYWQIQVKEGSYYLSIHVAAIRTIQATSTTNESSTLYDIFPGERRAIGFSIVLGTSECGHITDWLRNEKIQADGWMPWMDASRSILECYRLGLDTIINVVT